MATPTDIANLALAHLGEGRLVDLTTDDSEAAEVMRLFFDISRQRALRAANWTCAQKRAALAAEVTPPAFGYSNSFPLPGDYVRLCGVENAGEGSEFKVEGRKILTNLSAPLNILYIYDLENTSAYDPDLVAAFALWLAYHASGRLAPSRSELLRQHAEGAKVEAKITDGSSNSPQPLQGGTWLIAQDFSRDPSKWG